MSIYVDPREITWFYVVVHCPVTHQEAWDFQRSLGPQSRAWRLGLPEAQQKLSGRIPFGVVGTKGDAQLLNGA
jgi:hypothetical protein